MNHFLCTVITLILFNILSPCTEVKYLGSNPGINTLIYRHGKVQISTLSGIIPDMMSNGKHLSFKEF